MFLTPSNTPQKSLNAINKNKHILSSATTFSPHSNISFSLEFIYFQNPDRVITRLAINPGRVIKGTLTLLFTR